jgi:hypothetical protein
VGRPTASLSQPSKPSAEEHRCTKCERVSARISGDEIVFVQRHDKEYHETRLKFVSSLPELTKV